MAMIATDTTEFAGAKGFFTRVNNALVAAMAHGYKSSPAYRASRYASELSKLTDEELAARGLKRHEIAQHAFAGLPLV